MLGAEGLQFSSYVKIGFLQLSETSKGVRCYKGGKQKPRNKPSEGRTIPSNSWQGMSGKNKAG